MPPSICYICAFACHPRLFASKDEAAIVSQSIGDGRRDRACLGYGMAVGKVTGHSVISIKLGGRQEQRANAAFIPLSLPSTFSLFLLGRAALAGPPAIPILSACLVRASRSPSSFRTEQRSSSPPFRQASLTSTGPSLSSTSASPSFTNRHQSSRRNGKPGVARIRSLRLPHGHRL